MAATKKARQCRGFNGYNGSDDESRSVPGDDRAAEAIVHPDGSDVDVLLVGVGALEGAGGGDEVRAVPPMNRWPYSTATDQPGAKPNSRPVPTTPPPGIADLPGEETDTVYLGLVRER
jgi:hypothetical protein